MVNSEKQQCCCRLQKKKTLSLQRNRCLVADLADGSAFLSPAAVDTYLFVANHITHAPLRDSARSVKHLAAGVCSLNLLGLLNSPEMAFSPRLSTRRAARFPTSGGIVPVVVVVCARSHQMDRAVHT